MELVYLHEVVGKTKEYLYVEQTEEVAVELALAAERKQHVPRDLTHNKGWVGQLLERVLGATAGSHSEPDFQALGIELKTIPIARDGRPKETTYVCTVPLIDNSERNWQTSCVCLKLQRVLWIPIESKQGVALAERKLGSPLIWSPHPREEAVIREDWEELMDMVCLGKLESITAHHGTWLQIRPKAANSKSLQWGIGETGEKVLTIPRGFYLRKTFTEQILRSNYIMPK